MIWPFNRKSAEKKPVTRRGIFLSALLISMIAGGIELFEPLEYLYRGGRNVVLARPADQKIVVVAIDNAAVRRFGSSYYSRKYNAELLDRLFEGGGFNPFGQTITTKPS